jgi:CubicO group peptidase (beta-lactamase class C family)
MAYSTGLCCRISSLILAFMLMLQVAAAQSSSNAVNYNFNKVDNWLKENVSELGGRAVIVIYKDGKLVYKKAENEMSRRQIAVGKFIAKRQGKDADEALQDFTSTTKERIASCSKWLSAALVMTFIDDGSLKLQDTVGKFLPVMIANGKGAVTIWQCLSHLTGIKAGTIKETNQAMKDMQTMDEAIELIAKQPMEGLPGKTFHYSNAGLQIAAAVIEKISGKNFETLFAERIAKPCDMINSDFGKGKVALPAGGGWSTAEDYLKFISMILNEGQYNGKQVLSKNSIVEMQKNRVGKDVAIVQSPAEAGNWGYGFGEWVMDDATGENRSVAVTSPGLFGSFPWIDRNLNYAAFLFTFNINSKGRNERYKGLKKITDAILVK